MAMLACLSAFAMAVEVEHEFVALDELDQRLALRLNDGWEVAFSNFLSANPGEQGEFARMLFIFKKGTP